MTHSHAEIRALLQLHGLTPSRALRQNFVGDANTVRRIARLAEVGAGDHVVEIGPDLGSLSLALLETGAALTVVEMDRFLVPILEQMLPDSRVVHAGALEVDWPALLGAESWVLVANLPYNVATPVVLTVLERAPMVRRMLVMVQKEVGERFAAKPRTKAYGAVSLKVAWSAKASMAGKVPPTVFVPKPTVDSALVPIHRPAERSTHNNPLPAVPRHDTPSSPTPTIAPPHHAAGELRRHFLENIEVQRPFPDPATAWDEAFRDNDGGVA